MPKLTPINLKLIINTMNDEIRTHSNNYKSCLKDHPNPFVTDLWLIQKDQHRFVKSEKFYVFVFAKNAKPIFKIQTSTKAALRITQTK